MEYTKSATYVSLETIIILQDKRQTEKYECYLNIYHIDIQPVSLTLFKYWYAYLYPLQNMTLYGIILLKLTYLKPSNSDTSTIWTLTALICRADVLWKLVYKANPFTSKWYGWMLVYLTNNFFNLENHCQSKNIRSNINTIHLWIASYKKLGFQR